ncbi:MAG: VanZ family protein [Myxococcota bacterium]
MQSRARTIFAWAVALAWAGFVWGLGTDGFSASETSRFLGPLLDWLRPELDAVARTRALFAVRKLAHVVEYGVLALLVGRALAITTGARMRFVVAAALACVLALAAADETRQTKTAHRTGAASDVVLDVAGGALALGIWLAQKRARGRALFEATQGLAPGGHDGR